MNDLSLVLWTELLFLTMIKIKSTYMQYSIQYAKNSFVLLLFYLFGSKTFFCLVLSCSFGFVTFSNEWEAQKAKDSSDEERTLDGR